MIHTQDADFTLLNCDVLDGLHSLADGSVHCVVTSPPYWGLRDYGTGEWEGGDPECDHEARANRDDRPRNGLTGGTAQVEAATIYRDACGKCGARRVDQQLGLEPTPDLYVARMVEVFREVRRVLRDDGTCWLNLGSSYASGDTPPSRSRRGAPAYGNGGREPADSLGLGSAYRDLCDGCLADFLNHRDRKADTRPQPSLDAQPHDLTGRDNERSGFEPAFLDASPRDARVSTSLESWLRLRGECSRCASRASALSDVRTSASDALASSHMPWLNYTSRLKPKDMVPTPWMVAMALQQDGWYLRADIVWGKSNPMPESVTDRPTKAHEYVFLLAKQPRYFFDQEAVREPSLWADDPRADNGHIDYDGKRKGEAGTGQRAFVSINSAGRNVRSVWEIATQPYPEAHFATYPEELVRRCVLAGTSERGCCPECGAQWKRDVVTDNPSLHAADNDARGWANTHSKTSNAQSSKSLHRNKGGVYSTAVTLGWEPGCRCGMRSETGIPKPIPCTVLDPFNGSGTTAYVARKHGRRSIGIELNPDYCQLAAKRMAQQSLEFA